MMNCCISAAPADAPPPSEDEGECDGAESKEDGTDGEL